MNIGATACFSMAVTFLIFSIIFALSKEKCAMLLAGFNMLPKWKQEHYDKSRIAKDKRDNFFIWFLLCLTGGILSHFFSGYISIIVFIIWIILYIKDINIDAEKAFSKYKINKK